MTARATLSVISVRETLELHLVAELALAAPAFAVTPAQVAIAFRGARGELLERGTFDVVLPADGSSVLKRRLFNMRVASAETLEILVRGARTLCVPIATFALDGTMPR